MRDEVKVEILWVNETCFIWYLENYTIWLQEADNVIQVIHGSTKTQMKLIETCFLHKEANGSKFHWISQNYWKEGGIWCRISLWTKAGVLVGSMLVCRYTHWCVHVEFRGQRKRMDLWIAAVKWHKPWRTWSWPSKWHCSKWHRVDVSPSPRGYSSSMIFFLFSNALGHFCLLNRFAARVFLSPRTTGLGGSEHPTEDPVPSTPSSPKKKGKWCQNTMLLCQWFMLFWKKCMIHWKNSRFAMLIFSCYFNTSITVVPSLQNIKGLPYKFLLTSQKVFLGEVANQADGSKGFPLGKVLTQLKLIAVWVGHIFGPCLWQHH